ncbi:hypothetical protein NMG60_11004068 [Bertholletia excelsa]
MGRSPCCSKEGLNRGAWTAIEDKILTDYIRLHGEGKWRSLPKRAGLKRCGKSCRLRWLNYLRPDIKRGNITRDEEDLIIRLHKLLGNRWSLIAGRLPGRTDNEIKNYWNTSIAKKVQGNPSSASPSKSLSKPSRTNSDQLIPTVLPSTCHPQPNTEPPSVFCNNTSKSSRVDPAEPLGGSSAPGPLPDRELSSFSDDDFSAFVMDFEMDEKFLSDFLCPEFVLPGNVDGWQKGGTEVDSDSTHINAKISSFESDSDRTLFFSNNPLDDCDLQAVATLLDSGVGCLQD